MKSCHEMMMGAILVLWCSISIALLCCATLLIWYI